MKVSELVEMLSDVDQDREVVIDPGGLTEYEILDVDEDEDGDIKYAIINIRKSN